MMDPEEGGKDCIKKREKEEVEARLQRKKCTSEDSTKELREAQGVNAVNPGMSASFQMREGKGKRESVKVVDVGIHGLPMAEAASRWGATMLGVVTPNRKGRELARDWFPWATTGSSKEVMMSGGDIKKTLSVVTGIGPTEDKVHKFWAAVRVLQPKTCLLLAPTRLSRRTIEEQKGEYKIVKRGIVSHEQVGGVTTSQWKVLVALRGDMEWEQVSGNELSFADRVPYSRAVKSVLKPTEGLPYGAIPEISSHQNTPGSLDSTAPGERCYVVGDRQGEKVYSDEGHIVLANQNWVETKSVYHPTHKIIRRMTPEERLAAWDYTEDMVRPGQVDKGNKREVRRVFEAPPGKITRFVIGTLFNHLEKVAKETDLGEKAAAIGDDRMGELTELNTSAEDQEQDYSKATKADDAKVDVSLWDRNVSKFLGLQGKITPELARGCELLRGRMFSWWRKRITLECVQHLRVQGWMKRDVEAGRECIERAANSTFMEWTDGSRLFFWRWPKEFQEDARDGIRLWYSSRSERWFGRSTPADTQEAENKMRDKEDKLISRRYLERGKGVYVESVVPRFAVQKGDSDIRVVWDAKKNGVNDHLWAPHFFLPGSSNLESLLTHKSFQGDMDVGEMFLNFMLHFKDRKHFGVRYFSKDDKGKEIVELTRFCRLMFGSKCSPYAAVQMMYRAMEVIVGNPEEPNNIFNWVDIKLNLPGDENYEPWKSRLSKITAAGEIAPDVIFYVDDGRAVGFSQESCHLALRRISSVLNMLGIQDAARKRRPPMKQPGAWAGVVTDTTTTPPTAGLSEEKWKRLQEDIEWLECQLDNPKGIELKKALSVRGFLIHAARVYPDIKPYLKPLHLTLESWRPNKDADGWTRDDWMDQLDDNLVLLQMENSKAPAYVQPVPLLQWSIGVLKQLTRDPKPIRRPIRARKGTSVVYGFGDASGDGFGSSFKIRGANISVRHGVWCSRISEESSNYREFRNLLDAIRIEAEEDKLYGTEVWMFTDNWVAEACYSKGSCHSKALNAMVAELHILAMNHGFTLEIVHVAGTRMIAQGTDQLSRGEFQAGVMGGEQMLSYIPLNQGAVEQHQDLIHWVKSWAGTWTGQPLKPKDWFTKGHFNGVHLWTPPPAIALEVLEQLSVARHKRPFDSTHIVLIPRLMYNRWRKRLIKEADLVLEIPAGVECWPQSKHEPLILAVCCSVCKSAPFRVREKKEVVEIFRTLQDLRKEGSVEFRDCLREFWSLTLRIVGM